MPDLQLPVLIDRTGNGFHHERRGWSAFDIDADVLLDRVAWTAANSGNAWLAYDRNGNGTIDDGSELFGNNTPSFAGQTTLKSLNGFEALRFTQGLDYGASYVDDQIDGRDCVFNKLLLWTDANHNGISEPYELESAAGAGLLSVGLTYDERHKRDEYGNQFRLRGSSDWLSGRGKARQSRIWDVWLQTEK
jgi:hypothetical protein